MNNEKDIHPSIIAALRNEMYEPEQTAANGDASEETTVERFSFGDHEPTLLDAIKAIIELSENSMLSNDFFFEAEESLSYLSKRLDISRAQALMLSLVVNDYIDQSIDVTNFGRHLRCIPITLLPLLKEMKGLEQRGFIVCNQRGRRPTYRIPYPVVEALNENEVARHHTIDTILHGSDADDLALLTMHCDQERLEKKGAENRLLNETWAARSAETKKIFLHLHR